jgi:hypothetical protein
MAALDWSQCPAVESIPGKASGAWMLKGTRLSIGTAAALEFSVFPFAEYATRQLLSSTRFGIEHARYNEITIFGNERDTRKDRGHADFAQAEAQDPKPVELSG